MTVTKRTPLTPIVICLVIYVLVCSLAFVRAFSVMQRLKAVGLSTDATVQNVQIYQKRVVGDITYRTNSGDVYVAQKFGIAGSMRGSDADYARYLASGVIPIVYNPNNPADIINNSGDWVHKSHPFIRRDGIFILLFSLPALLTGAVCLLAAWQRRAPI
jgi:hypothetical protein